MTNEPLLKIGQLSEKTGLKIRTIRTLYGKKAIPCIRLGHSTLFFDLEAVKAALAKREIREIGR